MYRLIESIKVENNKIYNLFYHRQRIKESLFQCYASLTSPIDFDEIRSAISKIDPSLHKLRIVYDVKNYSYTLEPYEFKKINSLTIVDGQNFKYPLKYEDRTYLKQLFEQRKKSDDILISINGKLTDSYYANVAFEKDNMWYTPDQPLLKGTQRQCLLDNKKIIPASIAMADLPSYHNCRLFNAMIDFGKIEIPISKIQ